MNKKFNDWLDEIEGKKQSTYDYIKKLIEIVPELEEFYDDVVIPDIKEKEKE